MKRSVSVFLIISTMLMLIMQVFSALPVIPEGAEPAENFVYTISGSEVALKGFYPKNASGEYANNTNLDTVIIPSRIDGATVTSLNQTFYYKYNTTSGTSGYTLSKSRSFVIPDTVKTITAYTFRNQTNITSVELPASLTTLQGDTFFDCTALTSLTFTGETPPSLSGAPVNKAVTVYYPAGRAGYEDPVWQGKFKAGTVFAPTGTMPTTAPTSSPEVSQSPSPSPSPSPSSSPDVSGIEARLTYIVDNTDSGFSKSGTWATSTGKSGFYGSNYFSANSKASDPYQASWKANIERPGTYAVYYHQPTVQTTDTTVNDAAPYTITHQGGFDVVEANQRRPSGWYKLGEFVFDTGIAEVKLSAFGSGAVIADAIGFECLENEVNMDDADLEKTGEWNTFEDSSAHNGSYSVSSGMGTVKHSFNVNYTSHFKISYNVPIYAGRPENVSVALKGADSTINTVVPVTEGQIELYHGRLDKGVEYELTISAENLFCDYLFVEVSEYNLIADEFYNIGSIWNITNDAFKPGSGKVDSNQGKEGVMLASVQEPGIEISSEFIVNDSSGVFGYIISRGSDNKSLLYNNQSKRFEYFDNSETPVAQSGEINFSQGRHKIQIYSVAPYLRVYIDGAKIMEAQCFRPQSEIGLYVKNANVSFANFFCKSVNGAVSALGQYKVRLDQPQQIIWGLGIEVQSDSIGSGNNGLPEENTSVPHDLTQPERDRLYADMLKGFRYLRLAGGLYYRGTDNEQKHLVQRWDTQNEELAELIRKSGIEGVDFEFWSPTPYFKSTNSYIGGYLKCFDESFDGDVDAFLQDFAHTIRDDIKYLNDNGIPVIQFGLQNEPSINYANYSQCKYTDSQYYKTMKAVIPVLKSEFPDLHVHANSEGGQFGKGSALIKNDSELLAMVDAWTWHKIGVDSNDQIINAGTYNKDTKGKFVYNNEFEYLDKKTDDVRCINTAQSIMNWMTFVNSPTWHWLHMLKPMGNSEASGYSLGFFRAQGDTTNYNSKYNGLAEGEWDYNYQNWNAIRGFLKYMPWDSQRYTVEEDTIRFDQRIMSFKNPDGKLVVVITNRSQNDLFQFNIDTGINGKFNGYRYTPGGKDEINLGSLNGSTISPVIPPLSIEFWVESDDTAEYGISDLTVTDSDDTQTLSSLPNGAFNVKVPVTNNSGSGIKTLIVAAYDENRLTEVKIIDVDLPAGGSRTLTAAFDNNDSDAGYIKAFIVDSLDYISPLTSTGAKWTGE